MDPREGGEAKSEEEKREEAKAHLEIIRTLKTGIKESDRESLMASSFRYIVLSHDHLRKSDSDNKTLLSRELNSSKDRFVFEMIQNAEDCKYTTAQSEYTQPFLSFTAKLDEIIVDSNEDGFTTADVYALCNTANSDKKNVPGYIGQKGVGFKSVFQVARKVHVQSGAYSFAFDCRDERAKDGLSMVTPLDEEHQELPDGVQTRIKLMDLYDPGNEQDGSITEMRLKTLFDVPAEFLLFFNKLQRFEIHRQFASETSTKIYEHRSDDQYAYIDSFASTGLESESRYRLFRKFVYDLPSDEARTHTSAAEIVLAFCMDSEDEPVFEEQYVFAFLPLQPVGFKFLIQSDFIVLANREGVTDCPWNRKLRDHVADVFCEAVSNFCQHDTLVHHWLGYLPKDDISDPFWKALRPMIIGRLAEMEIIDSRGGKLWKPRQMRFLQDKHKDLIGAPLYPDIPEKEIYIFPYPGRYCTKLDALGVKDIQWDEILDRYIRGIDKSQDWHTRAANLLLEACNAGGRIYERIMRMSIIPLEGGNYTSGNHSPIYFQVEAGSRIPADLGFNLVPLSATRNVAGVILFKKLGVKDCPPDDVKTKIYQRYSPNQAMKLVDHVSHLLYLYENVPSETTDIAYRMPICDEGHLLPVPLRRPYAKKRMYFAEASETDPYGAKDMLWDHQEALRTNSIHFINTIIAEKSNNTTRFGRTFKDWLKEAFGIVQIPQLVHHEGHRISFEYEKIIESTPEKLVYMLREHWSHYKDEISKFDIRQTLFNAEVPVEGSDARLALCQTYLPLPSLTEIVNVSGFDIKFEFLLLHHKLCDKNANEWHFLEEFGVGVRDDCRFYIRILNKLCHRVFGKAKFADWSSIYNIYERISKRCVSEEDRELVRQEFRRSWKHWIYDRLEMVAIICLRSSVEPGLLRWFSLNDCVWSGPEWLTVKHRLEKDYASLNGLFKNILDVRDCNWEDYLDELANMKKHGVINREKATSIYFCLSHEFRVGHNSLRQLRSKFDEEELLAIPNESTWESPRSCVWVESDVRIPGKHSIGDYGLDLAQFFIKTLQVPRPTLRMDVEALKGLATVKTIDDNWKDQVKQTLMRISALNPDREQVSELLKEKIFPVRQCQRYQDAAHTSCAVEFAINDRSGLVERFPDITVLDFSIEEVHKCSNVFAALGLAERYMSTLVEESTEVEKGPGEQPHESLTKTFRLRAFALFRCAAHYTGSELRYGNLTRVQASEHPLFKLLLDAEIYAGRKIYKSMTVYFQKSGRAFESERQDAYFHLDKSSDGLRLYVPASPKYRELCYLRELPQALKQYLSISDTRADKVLHGIVNSNSLFAVCEILKDAGIIEVPGIECPYETDEGEQNTKNDESEPSAESAPGYIFDQHPIISVEPSSAYSRTTTQPSSISYEDHIDRGSSPFTTASSVQSASSPYLRITLAPSSIPESTSPPERTGYQRLLDRVIRSASLVEIPSSGHPAFSGHTEANDSIFGYRCFSRDVQVGAAGELFVYEVFRLLSLPGFDMSCWQSTIRNQINVHENYIGLDKWHNRETSDIVYRDANGQLVEELRSKGYRSIRQGSKPLFFIEVKTTTLAWDEALYVSKRQYEKMAECHNSMFSDGQYQVYILVRVFNLEFGRLGLRMYVDPIEAQEKGQLKFKEGAWRVKPKMDSSDNTDVSDSD